MSKNKSPSWDLADLYENPNDPQLKKDKKVIDSLTSLFIKKYKGRINSNDLTPKRLHKALLDYENITEKLTIYHLYPSLLHHQNTLDHKIGLGYSEASEFASDITSKLEWFTLEIIVLSEAQTKKLLADSLLNSYAHFINKTRALKPYTLSEKEEVIITKKNLTGSNAFSNFYDKQTSSETFELKIKGKTKSLSLSEIGIITKNDPNRALRKKASEAVAHIFKKNQMFYTFTLNNLLLDKKINDEIRGYKIPEQATLLNYEISKKTLDAMVTAVTKNYSLGERYYKSKRKLLKLNELHEWDRYSSIYPDSNKKYTWSEAKQIILKSFLNFDKEFHDIAKLFFEGNWIDADIKKGKVLGAFCAYAAPSLHPYILMNFKGDIGDLFTLAHELGHGIHNCLAKNNSVLNYHPSTATAEIASIFAESLLFDYLIKGTTDIKLKTNMLASKIEGAFATIFRQTAFYLFEKELHSHRRLKGELSTEDFNIYYQKHLQKMFGKGLKLTEGHKYGWMPVLHFYHYNFYVFTYAFGELLTTALYAQYKKDSKIFIKSYKNALSLGGSKQPQEIVKTMGINISNESFWHKGLLSLQGSIVEFENLVKTQV